ncbi:DNRLRE domain-containing protein [Chondromyces crocatus]|uniref:Carbohydrate-binding module family 96 domain-containing protein n=1 Tax=Chondromyces crocatus TaxID=52 RepID=A0A0K1EA70_CHOCO|nr:DNRLRE domain-containing protein [Chondromyces crocatus]AKT37557.1 uncharacterized protein CMC5_016980 [Chondromyces crocatus]
MMQRNSSILVLAMIPVALSVGACTMEADDSDLLGASDDPVDRGGDLPGPAFDRGVLQVPPLDVTLGNHGLATNPLRCDTYRRGEHGHAQDATVYLSAPSYNDGASDNISAGEIEQRKLALVGFDLSDLPRGVEISKAELGLSQAWTDRESTIRIHPILAAWDENDVTWNSFEEAYEPEEIASFQTVLGEGHHVVDVTDTVAEWRRDRNRNDHGFVIDTAGKRHAFWSSEHSALEHRPYLRVCYRVHGTLPPPH